MHSKLPPEILHLIIDNLVQPLDWNDSASIQTLCNCTLVCARFYIFVRPFLCRRLVVQPRDLEDPQFPLLAQFVELFLADPPIRNLPPLLFVARRIEIVLRLDRQVPTFAVAMQTNVGQFMNGSSMTSLLESFSLSKSSLNSFSLKCHGRKVNLSWVKHFVVEGGTFSQLFKTLCKTKITHLRLCGIEDLPSSIIDQATSVKHLTLHQVRLSHAEVEDCNVPSPDNIITTSMLNPIFLDVKNLVGDLRIFLDPLSASAIPYDSLSRHESLHFGLVLRFPLLIECRLHWTVSSSLEFLGCIYEAAPNLQVMRIDGPCFREIPFVHPRSRLDSSQLTIDPQRDSFYKCYPPWTRSPPGSLRTFELSGLIIIEAPPQRAELLRYLNLEAILASTSQLPKLTNIIIRIQFTINRRHDDQYWFFSHPIAKIMWERLFQALRHCIKVDMTFEIIIGRGFEVGFREGEPPCSEEDILEKQEFAKRCLEDTFRPLTLVNPKAKLIVHLVK